MATSSDNAEPRTSGPSPIGTSPASVGCSRTRATSCFAPPRDTGVRAWYCSDLTTASEGYARSNHAAHDAQTGGLRVVDQVCGNVVHAPVATERGVGPPIFGEIGEVTDQGHALRVHHRPHIVHEDSLAKAGPDQSSCCSAASLGANQRGPLMPIASQADRGVGGRCSFSTVKDLSPHHTELVAPGVSHAYTVRAASIDATPPERQQAVDFGVDC